MPEGIPVPANETGPLMAWVRDVVSDFQRRWLSPRGVSITTTLNRYVTQGRIKFNVVTVPANAVWANESGGRIYIYVEQNAKNAATYGGPTRRYSATNPGGWLIGPDDHYLSRGGLVTNLAHEGLHACLALPGDGSLDEELDARLAANAASAAMGLTGSQAVGRSYAGSITALRDDYDLPPDPTYVPLGGTWPAPWATAH
ncbi:MAG: hypothetical protein H0T56_17835 [Pseudaminobacter sp.]|nr:hypothetical protein [Pseudaminobacter sp.]